MNEGEGEEIAKKTVLVWFDILGFDELAEKAEKEGIFESREVRLKFIATINDQISTIKNSGEILGESYGNSDDWVIATASIDLAFKNIFDILEHKTGLLNSSLKKLQLEFAIGVGEYDKWAKLNGVKLIVEKSTIEFLKTKIINHYHCWYKKHYATNIGPESTYIVLSESAYTQLEPLDKKIFKPLPPIINGNTIITYFVADIEGLRRRAKMCEFLRRIDRPIGDIRYGRIDEVFVPPEGFNKIEEP